MKGASHMQGDTTNSPPRVLPSLATPLIICLSFIVLNNFFANMCVKKIILHQPKVSPLVTEYNCPLACVKLLFTPGLSRFLLWSAVFKLNKMNFRQWSAVEHHGKLRSGGQGNL